MNRCISFFNFGDKCITELLVATYTLRKHYDGEIVWILADDIYNKKLAKQVDGLKVNIKTHDFSKFKRNTKSAIKPSLFKYLLNEEKYDSVIMCDGDLLFLNKIDELWTPLEEKGMLLTQFLNWNTGGPIMRGRLDNLEGHISSKDLKNIYKNKHPSINIGLMGFTRKGYLALTKWEYLTEQLAGLHIADEICIHAVFPFFNCHIAESKYNASAKLSDLKRIEENIVIHYHGSCQGGGDVELNYENRRRSSRLWFAYLNDFYKSNIVPEAKYWEKYATSGIGEILNKNPNLLEECSKEFKC